MWKPACLLFGTLLLLSGVKCDKKLKAVTTHLNAKWSATPLILEVAEYLAEENNEYFWGFVDKISLLEKPIDSLGKYILNIINRDSLFAVYIIF